MHGKKSVNLCGLGGGGGRRCGFTLIEMLVVISIIAVLIGILVPAVSVYRRRAQKAGCNSNLHQIGLAVQMYLDDSGNKSRYPLARGTADPFKTTDTDPPLPVLLRPYVAESWPDEGASRVYRCPGDSGYVYKKSHTSYQYEVGLGGWRFDELLIVRFLHLSPSDVMVCRDFDGATFELNDGNKVDVPFFHDLRSFLFADGHAGDFTK